MPDRQTLSDNVTLYDIWLERLMRRNPLPVLWVLAIISVLLAILVSWRVHTTDDPSAKQLALDAAAAERAAAFVHALGFEPGPAVCRARESGSAWCTVRVSGSDKTFSLWCSQRHPTCIENLARQ